MAAAKKKKPAAKKPAAKKAPAKGTPAKGGKGGKGTGAVGDQKRFVVEIGTGGYVRATQRAMDKLGLSAATFASGEERRGSKGTKSIKVVFSDGSKVSVPVPGKFKRSDYAEIATSAGGEGYTTPAGMTYRLGDGGGGGAKKPPAKQPAAKKTPAKKKPAAKKKKK